MIPWSLVRIQADPVLEGRQTRSLSGLRAVRVQRSKRDIAIINDTGKILEVWKKQPDGQWKCIVDAYNSDIPLPAA